MGLYLIADFVIDIQNKYEFLEKQCAGYKYEGTKAVDFTVQVTDEEIQRERMNLKDEFSIGYLESVCAYRKLCLKLPLHDAILLHSAVISCDGRGIAFLARSGVGKTTHTMLWKRVFKDRVKIINGDKPIIRFINGVPYAYGTPWAGKENFQINDKVRLTDVCFIERADVNSAEMFKDNGYFNALMMQILHPSDASAAMKTLDIIDELVSVCNFWKIRCNVSEQAALTAYNSILGEEKNEIKI